jgi:chromosome segregation ATPase
MSHRIAGLQREVAVLLQDQAAATVKQENAAKTVESLRTQITHLEGEVKVLAAAADAAVAERDAAEMRAADSAAEQATQRKELRLLQRTCEEVCFLPL